MRVEIVGLLHRRREITMERMEEGYMTSGESFRFSLLQWIGEELLPE